MTSSIRLWDVKSGEQKALLSGHSDSVRSVAFSPDGETLASGSSDDSIRLWDVKSGEQKAILSGHSDSVRSVAFSPDGETLASGSSDSSIRLWDVKSGEQKALLSGHSSDVSSVAFSPDGETLASGSNDKSIRLWDVKSGEQKAILSGHSDSVFSVAFSPDGQTLASGSRDTSIRLWDVKSGEQKALFSGHSDFVLSVALSPDGETLASGSGGFGDDKSIRLWDVKSGEQKALLSGHSDSVRSVAFSPDGETLASGSGGFGDDKSIRLWDVKSGEQKALLNGHSDSVLSVAFSPDGETLASGSRDNSIRLWDVKSGEQKALLSGHSSSVLSVAFSPDGETLASGSSDHSIRLWDVKSGEQKALLSGHSSAVGSVAFSPDGQTLASGSRDNSIRLWDVKSGEQKALLSGHSSYVGSVAFSPDGETLASGSEDNSIRLWDVKSGEQKALLSGHSYSVWSVAFSPDGETLASGSDDKSIRLWDVKSGEQKALLSGHSDSVWSVAFSPDGETLASGSSDNSIRLWETRIVRTNLYIYLKEGWCEFDSNSQQLVWKEPKRHLYRSIETPFRNVPKHSSLGIQQNQDLTKEERNWRLYLKVIEAENWAAAEIFHAQLSDQIRTRPHANVMWAASKVIPTQIAAAVKAESPTLAEMRTRSALRISSQLGTSKKDAVFSGMGEAFARAALPKTKVEFLLTVLPDERGREMVAVGAREWIRQSAAIQLRGVRRYRPNFSKITEALTYDESWGAVESISVFEAMEISALITLYRICDASKEEGALPLAEELISVIREAVGKTKGKSRAEALRLLAQNEVGADALARWRQLLKTEHAEYRDFQQAGSLAADLGEGGACREIFTAGLGRFEKNSGYLNYEFGTALRKLGEDNEALPYFQKAKANPAGLDVNDSFYGLAKLLDDLGRTEEASKLYQELLADDEAETAHIEAALGFAKRHGHSIERIGARAMRVAAGQEEGSKALALWRKLLKTEHAGYHDYQRAGDLAADLGDGAACREIFTAGLARFEDQFGWLNYEFATALRKLGEDEEALPYFQKAKANPAGLDVNDSFYGLAKLLDDLGRTEEASKLYQELLAHHEAELRHKVTAGAFAKKHGYADGTKILTDLVAKTEDARELGSLSWVLLETGEFEMAAQAGEKAAKSGEPLAWVEGIRASAYLFLGRMEEAMEIHKRYKGKMTHSDGKRSWEEVTKEDFGHFRSFNGLVTSKVEARFREIEVFLGLREAEPKANPADPKPEPQTQADDKDK